MRPYGLDKGMKLGDKTDEWIYAVNCVLQQSWFLFLVTDYSQTVIYYQEFTYVKGLQQSSDVIPLEPVHTITP